MDQPAVASASFQPPSRQVDDSAREPLLMASDRSWMRSVRAYPDVARPSVGVATAAEPGAKPPPPPPPPPAPPAPAATVVSQERAPPPGSAPALVRVALLPESNVDFPQITEICERIEAEPAEAAKAVAVLANVLRGKAAYRTKLKALTISHEMLYDSRAVAEFRSVEGFSEVLASLRNARDTGLGEPVDQNIRMLATEIDKVCFAYDQGKLPTRKAPSGHVLKRGMSNLHRTMSDAVDKAGQKIDRTLSKPEVQSAMQGMERNLERAGETIERTAGFAASAFYKASSKMMQEAERLLGPGNENSPSPSPTRRERAPVPAAARRSASPRQPPRFTDDATNTLTLPPQSRHKVPSPVAGPLTVPEQLAAERAELENAMQDQTWLDQQMQWALSASLAAASTSRDASSSATASSTTSAVAKPSESATEEMVQAAEAREARAQQEFAKVVAVAPEREAVVRRLRKEVNDSNSLVSGLTDRITEVEIELKRVTAQSAELSARLAAEKPKLQALMPTASTPAASVMSEPSAKEISSPAVEPNPPPSPPPPKQEAET